MDSAGQAEFLKTVAARSSKDHLVAKASGTAIDHARDAEAVDRDEAIDVAVVAKERPDPAQIAEFFLADGADQHHVTDGAEAVGAHGLNHRDERRKPARVVSDPRCPQHPVGFAHGDVGVLCKYCI
jgi:hypothetical protein